ncbi:MAG: sirohydrochlorin cobaltochelatase, partial [Clostridia bacterium]|nr:sirohydrochlorin cobaltochelatase [Clostridia bacterium]
VAGALLAGRERADTKATALVFVGHGTERSANAAFGKLERVMHERGCENAFVGAALGQPSAGQVLEKVRRCGATKVALIPLMLVAGGHVRCDMAGEAEGSWKSVFMRAGFEVECVTEGMGQNEAIRAIYVEHVQRALKDSGF